LPSFGRWRGSLRKILNLEAVVIVAPLATGKHLLRDLPNSQIGKAVRLATESGTQDK
jgi:hypothetical protein